MSLQQFLESTTKGIVEGQVYPFACPQEKILCHTRKEFSDLVDGEEGIN
jgi:hypothetical protein